MNAEVVLEGRGGEGEKQRDQLRKNYAGVLLAERVGGGGQRNQLRKVNAGVVLAGMRGGVTERQTEKRVCRVCASGEGRRRDREAS